MSQVQKKKVEKKSKKSRLAKANVSRLAPPTRPGASNMQSISSGGSTMSKRNVKKKTLSIQQKKPQGKGGTTQNTDGGTKGDTRGEPDSKPLGALAQFTTKNREYFFIHHIRNPPAHGEFLIKDKEGKNYIIRLEPNNRCKLKYHNEILQEMSKTVNDEKVPLLRSIEYGSSTRMSKNFLIITPFGNHLHEVLKIMQKFTTGCAYNVALQSLDAIRYLHQAGYVNRNIKPATFSIGFSNDEPRVLMSDFRLVRTHIECKKVRKARTTVKYCGTARYASIAGLTLKEQGRRDDLESWMYMFYEMLDPNNGLSWRRMPRCTMLIKEKENFKAHVLPYTYTVIPQEFKKLVDLIHGYTYESEPDYKAIREMVETIGKAKKVDMTQCDWFGKISADRAKAVVKEANERSTGNRCSGEDDFEYGKKPVRKIMNEGDTIKNGAFTWRVVNLLGSGGFGDVYKVYDERNKQKHYALKTESEEGKKVMLRLKVEMQVLMAINEARKKDTTRRFYRHFVDFIDRGKSDDLKCKFIVMSLVGPSLDDVRKKWNVSLNNKQSGYIVAIQSVEAVRDLHNLGYLHRDIKPANFAVGFQADEWLVFMLDFGIGRSYLDPKTREHRAPRKSVKFLGTLRFASRACMKGIDQGRKDDLECWLYMMYDILDPEHGLPWREARSRNDITAAKDRFFASKSKLKKEESDEEEEEEKRDRKSPTKGMKALCAYVNNLQFQATPDYEYIINHLHHTAEASGFPISNMQKGEWVGKLNDKNRKIEKTERFGESESGGSGESMSPKDEKDDGTTGKG